jgi:hypothetical protein
MNPGGVRVGVEAVEICGPGLENWESGRLVLAGDAPYCPASIVLPAPPQLSPAERRRAILTVRLALTVGTGAIARSDLDPTTLPAVFASSGADADTINSILLRLATPDRQVSPTQFHNSVHNAPSGYWGVAMHSREAVTSLSAYDASFAAGLLEAGVQAQAGKRPVLLIAYDVPYPEPLDSARRITSSFGTAFVLSASPSARALASLQISMTDGSMHEVTSCDDPALEALRRGNPAARCLPLLALLAARSSGTVYLDFNRSTLEIVVMPC